MPQNLPDSFPNNSSDQELLDLMIETNRSLARIFRHGLTGQLELKGTIEICKNELDLRNQKKFLNEYQKLQVGISKLKDEIFQLKKSNKKAGKWNIGLATLTIFLAIATIFIGWKTLNYSEADQDSDKAWRNDQLNALKESNFQLKELNKKLEQIPIVILPDSLK